MQFLNSSPQNSSPSFSEIVRGFVGAFLGIGLISVIEQFYLSDSDLLFVTGAFGATSVLVYGTPTSPFAQPYNVIVGHLLSSVIGVAIFLIIGEANWLSASLAVALSMAAMQVCWCVHPPGGATALIAVVASPEIHNLGFMYVLYPVGFGAVLLVGVAVLTNNIRTSQSWPVRWLE